MLVRLAVNGSSTVRRDSAPYLAAVEPGKLRELLYGLLANGDRDERSYAAALVARMLGGDAVPRLEEALAKDASKPVQNDIRAAIASLEAVSEAQAVEDLAAPPCPELEETRLGANAVEILHGNWEQMMAAARKAAAEERERNKTAKFKTNYADRRERHLAACGAGYAKKMIAALNGDGDLGKAAGEHWQLAFEMISHVAAAQRQVQRHRSPRVQCLVAGQREKRCRPAGAGKGDGARWAQRPGDGQGLPEEVLGNGWWPDGCAAAGLCLAVLPAKSGIDRQGAGAGGRQWLDGRPA
jgi:hypothetical protein